MLQEALKSENISESQVISETPQVPRPNIQIVDESEAQHLQSPRMSSKSSLDSDHDSHGTIGENEHGHFGDQAGSKAQKDAQAELQFNILMNKMIKNCPTRLVSQNVFKFGTNVITDKNYESELG